MTMDRHTRTSMPAVTPFKKVRKPIISKEERKREKASFRRYTLNGGGDEPA